MTEILTELHGREIGLDEDRALVIRSGAIRTQDGLPVSFPDGISGTGIDAASYGVVADGVTDDTTALQAAINAAVAANGILNLPEGEIITGPLTIGAAGSYNTCAIVGVDYDGHYSTTTSRRTVIKLKANSNDTLFTIPASDASDVGPGPVKFENLWLKGNSSNQTGTVYAVNFVSHTLTSNKQRSGFFRRVRIEDFDTGGVRAGTLRNAGIMEQVVILNIGSGGVGSALIFGSCQDWRFWACDFGVTGAAVVQDSGAQITTFTSCNFFNGGTHGYKADSGSGANFFVGCSFDRNERNGVTIAPSAEEHWTFSNCRFTINSQATNNTYFDVSVTDTPNVQFIGCYFAKGGGSITNFPAYHFDLSGTTTKGLSVIGCTFEATGAVGGIVADTSNLAIFGPSTYNSFRVIQDPLDVNHVRVEGGNTGAAVSVFASGEDTNVPIDLKSKGTGSVRFYTGATLQYVVSYTASATSYLQASGSAADQPALSAQGSGSNIDMLFTPKGTGNVRFGTYTAGAATDSTGYITVKDAGGTVRKLMVQA